MFDAYVLITLSSGNERYTVGLLAAQISLYVSQDLREKALRWNSTAYSGHNAHNTAAMPVSGREPGSSYQQLVGFPLLEGKRY